MELIGASMKGIYRDVLRGPDTRIIYDSGWMSNTIVESCRILLAGFVKNESANGLQYLAVGQGNPDWDENGASTPDETTSDLVHRYDPPIPVKDLQLVYLDNTDGVAADQSKPTSRLQITATLGVNYPSPIAPLNSYPLREFGLFARFGETDYMLNCIHHPVIHKDAATTLVRVIRLYF